jgi:hypothetical protein
MTQIEAVGVTGTVIFDGYVVTIRRDGFVARATIGKGIKQISIESITAMQWKPAGPLVNGYIQFTVPGGNEVRSRAGKATVQAGRDENSVIFTRKQMPAFEHLRGVLQAVMSQRRQPQQAVPDIADRIRRLNELLSQGLITHTEYELKRSQLLEQL